MRKREISKEYIQENISVDPDTGCWVWQKHIGAWGYGMFGRSSGGVRKTYKAHRASYELYVGPIPDGMMICHKCDNPACCNPEHLYAGTGSDNMNDMWSRDRHPKHNSKAGAKITVEQVNEIRELEGTGTLREIGAKYGISAQSVLNIFNRTRWKDV